MSAYRTTFHLDGTITVWDCYSQSYTRTSAPSARLLATLSDEERSRILRHTARLALH